jgi:hypothetical protein
MDDDGDDLTLTRRDALAAGAAAIVTASLLNPPFAAVSGHAILDAGVTLHVMVPCIVLSSIREPHCWMSFASGSVCSAPRKAVIRGSVAPALCI